MASGALHNSLVGSELHFSKVQVISGPPGSTPSYVGQTVFDQSNGTFYVAKNTSSAADWEAVVGVGGINAFLEVSTTTYTILSTSNGGVIGLTNPAARTVTMVTSPINGFQITVIDLAGTAATANITINGAFLGGGSSYVIKSNYGAVTFSYDLGSTVWVPVTSYTGQQLYVDNIYNIAGSDLNIGTVDTHNILLNVNNANILKLTSSTAEIKQTLYLDDPTDNTKQIAFAVATATTNTKTILNFAQTTNRILTFPDLTDSMVSRNSTDILTNKSFNNTTTILAANQLNFNNSANSFHTSLKAGANAANLDMTLPITAPAAGQVLYSTDTAATLGWITVAVAKTPTVQILNRSSFSPYTTPIPAPLYIRVRLCGGGGGGGSAFISAHTFNDGTTGGNTFFGSNITADGGTGGHSGGGSFSTVGGGGGIVGFSGSGGIGYANTGGSGGAAINLGLVGESIGGTGGQNEFGGGGAMCADTNSFLTQNAIPSTGGGGAGGSVTGSGNSGSGGGAGGFIDIIIQSPASSYNFAVGIGGAGGVSTAAPGGNGADGIIIVEEYYS